MLIYHKSTRLIIIIIIINYSVQQRALLAHTISK